jgi:EAL domain-containing protein (putative c-di-GMP-specific phosphodiesterase class I)
MFKNELGCFVPHYQPIVRLSDHTTAMFECLARFNCNGKIAGPVDYEHLFDNNDFLWQLFENSLPHIMAHTKNDMTICVNIDVDSLTNVFFTIVEDLANTFPDFRVVSGNGIYSTLREFYHP